MGEEASARPIGFWGIWALTVGAMVGSGIFLLPTVLAPFGVYALGGWVVTGTGAMCIAVVLGKLAVKSPRSGGPAVFVKDAFGRFAGFMSGWSLWVSFVIAVPAIAMAFVGYAGSLFPGLSDNNFAQIVLGLVLIWSLTFIALKGVKEAALATIVLTVLKLLPLIFVIGLAVVVGSPKEIIALEMPETHFLPSLAATALLTMWAFLGLEAGVVSTDAVADPQKTLPRAVSLGVLTVTSLYMLITLATMMLVPQEILMTSEAPLVDATRSLGRAGFTLVALGALISTAGALLAVLFVIGHLAFGMAQDGIAPKVFARQGAGDTPVAALVLGASIGSALMLLNTTEGLIGAFTFLLMMSTATALLPYLLCALAELKHSWGSSRGWITLAFVSAMYSFFALVGSGFVVLLWGGVLLCAGIPIYLLADREQKLLAAVGDATP